MKAQSSQCKPRKTTKIPQQLAEIGSGMFWFFFIHSFTINMLYISVHWTNTGQWRPMQTNEGQHRQMKAKTGQQRLMKAQSSQRKPIKTTEIPQQSAEIAKVCFYSVLFNHLLLICYISVFIGPTQANEDQCRPMKANKDHQQTKAHSCQCRVMANVGRVCPTHIPIPSQLTVH